MRIITFLFNRFSKVVLVMEVLGLVLILHATRIIFSESNPLHIALLVVVLCEYIFIRYCATRRWYKEAPRWAGIELQFKKALVPTSYILAILGATLLGSLRTIPLAIALVLLAVIAHVNVILINLHRRDRDNTPVNYFSCTSS